MASTYNYSWDQGEDLTLSLVYKEGPEGATVPIDLSLYKFRMDIIAPDGKVLIVANDESIADTDPFITGSQADTTYEVTLGVAGQITIVLPRTLTLPGGAFYNYLNANPQQTTFNYDMFLRDSSNKQKKILTGTITINKSFTMWV